MSMLKNKRNKKEEKNKKKTKDSKNNDITEKYKKIIRRVRLWVGFNTVSLFLTAILYYLLFYFYGKSVSVLVVCLLVLIGSFSSATIGLCWILKKDPYVFSQNYSLEKTKKEGKQFFDIDVTYKKLQKSDIYPLLFFYIFLVSLCFTTYTLIYSFEELFKIASNQNELFLMKLYNYFIYSIILFILALVIFILLPIFYENIKGKKRSELNFFDINEKNYPLTNNEMLKNIENLGEDNYWKSNLEEGQWISRLWHVKMSKEYKLIMDNLKFFNESFEMLKNVCPLIPEDNIDLILDETKEKIRLENKKKNTERNKKDNPLRYILVNDFITDIKNELEKLAKKYCQDYKKENVDKNDKKNDEPKWKNLKNVIVLFRNAKLKKEKNVEKNDEPKWENFKNNFFSFLNELLKNEENKEGKEQNIVINGMQAALFQPADKNVTNAYVLGTTGSGKTSKVIMPTILANANAVKQASFFISDPKGELYPMVSKYLENRGYKSYLLNLLDLTNTYIWNPLQEIYEKFLAKGLLKKYISQYETAHEKNNFVFDMSEINQNITTQIQNSMEYLEIKNNPDKGKEKEILFDEKTFSSVDELKNYLKFDLDVQISEKIRLVSQNIFLNSYDYGDTLTQLSSSLFEGALYNIGYCIENDVNFIPIEKFNIFSIVHLINSEGFLEKIFSEIDNLKLELSENKFNDSVISSKQKRIEELKSRNDYLNLLLIKEAPDELKKSIFRVFNMIMKPLLGDGIRSLTTSYKEDDENSKTKKNIISLRRISSDKNPTAVFLGFNIVDKTLHPFVSMFISSLHQSLSAKAKNSKKQKLDRAFMFILEEFGNIPTIPHLENIITTCRSENIKFMFIVQSNDQLDSKYNKEIILGNCELKIFLKTSSKKDIKWISEIIGSKDFKRYNPITMRSETIEKLENIEPWHYNIVIDSNKKYLIRIKPWFDGVRNNEKIHNLPEENMIKNTKIYSVDQNVINYFDWSKFIDKHGKH